MQWHHTDNRPDIALLGVVSDLHVESLRLLKDGKVAQASSLIHACADLLGEVKRLRSGVPNPTAKHCLIGT